MHYKQVFESWR